jgi:hypothetical protein
MVNSRTRLPVRQKRQGYGNTLFVPGALVCRWSRSRLKPRQGHRLSADPINQDRICSLAGRASRVTLATVLGDIKRLAELDDAFKRAQ